MTSLRRRTIERQLGALDGKIGQLTTAIEAGGHLPALLTALEARERERTSLLAELRSVATVAPARPKDRRALEQRLREKLIDWRGMLAGNVTHARQVLEQMLADRLVFTPTKDEDGAQCYRMAGTFALGRICSEILSSQGLASPT